MGVLGGGQKVFVEKFMCFSLCAFSAHYYRPPNPEIFKDETVTQKCRGSQNGCFGKRCFVPYRKQVVLTKIGQIPTLHSTHKNKGFAHQPRKSTKMTKMAGVTQQNDRLPKALF